MHAPDGALVPAFEAAHISPKFFVGHLIDQNEQASKLLMQARRVVHIAKSGRNRNRLPDDSLAHLGKIILAFALGTKTISYL